MIGTMAYLQMFSYLLMANIALGLKGSICEDGYKLNYTLPMWEQCSEKEHPVLGMVKTIPKIIPAASLIVTDCSQGNSDLSIRVCRFSDCLDDPCENGWCEDTMTGFLCHCSSEFTGTHCEIRLSVPDEVPTKQTARPMLIDCPGNINQSVELGSLNTTVSWTPPSVINTSGTPTITANIDPESLFDIMNETVTVIYTVTDDTGWIDQSCSFNISFHYVDTTPPDVMCLEDITWTVELGIQSTYVEFSPPSAKDISGSVHLLSHNPDPQGEFPIGTTTVEYVFADDSGNTANCSFNVIIDATDTTPPVVSNCPSDQTVTADLGASDYVFTWETPGATDAAGIKSFEADHASGVAVSVGQSITVTYIVIDNSGLTNTKCSFTLSVAEEADTTPPVVSNCPPDQTVTVNFGDATHHVFIWETPEATDAAGIASIVPDHNSGVEVSVGQSITVTYTVTDNSGLTNTDCSFTLSVVEEADTTPPDVSNCPPDQTIAAALGTTTTVFTWETPEATDAAGIASIVPDHDSGVEVSVGQSITVTYTVTDNSGLTNTDCSFTLSVVEQADTTPPVVSNCPSDQTVTVDLGATNHVFNWVTPQATDAAGIASIVPDHDSGVEVSVGQSITVTYTVTDNSGLTNTDCSFTLSVVEAVSDWKCTTTKCYLLDEERNWQEAYNFCNNLNIVSTVHGNKDPSLLFVDNDPDFEEIEHLFDPLDNEVWINCNDKATEGTLVCDTDGDGTQHTTTNWDDGEPSGGGQHDCVYVERISEKWKNKQCDREYRTMCQILLDDVIVPDIVT